MARPPPKKDISDKELDELLKKEEETMKREREAMKAVPAKADAKPGEKPEAKPGEKPGEPAAPVMGEYNPWGVLLYPHLAEKSMNMVEMENKLVFIVNRRATKKDIKEAIEKGFDVKVANVGVEMTTKGLKKAYIKLKEGYEAADVASRLGII